MHCQLAEGSAKINQRRRFLRGAVGMGLLTGEETAWEIDCAVRDIVEAAFRRSREVLEGNRGLLGEGSQLLLAKETLNEAELMDLFRRAEGRPMKLQASMSPYS